MTRSSAAARVFAWALLVGLAALPACRPSEEREREDGLRVAVIGDFGSDDANEASVAALIRSWSPDLVATVGDNNYPNGSADTIDANVGKYFHEFIAPYRGRFGAGASSNRFFPALGNHDWQTANAAPYFAYFDLPGNERYYTVRRGALDLFILDSDEHEPDGISRDSLQARWLQQALADSTARYRLVLLHHPPFSSGEHHSSPTLQWPFREWGATAVIAGHDHDYERIDRAGLPYVVCGTGGKRLYAFTKTEPGSQVRVADRHGALLIEVLDDHATARFVTGERDVLDSFALPARADLPAEIALIRAGERWEISGGAAASILRHRNFEVGDPAGVGWLELGLPLADEVRVSLNGVQVVHTTRGRKLRELSPAGGAALAHTMIDPHLLVPGTNVLAVELSHVGGPPDPSHFDAELSAFAAPTPLLRAGSDWSYLDDNRALPAGWKDAGFDDSGWRRGPAPLGYGADGLETRLLRPDRDSGPIRLRGEFTVASGSEFRQLLLRFARTGNGGIAFLNRVEIARWNLPDPELGTPAATACSGCDDSVASVETLVAANLLANGSNVLAVELYPRRGDGAGLSFDPTLLAVE